MSNRQRAIVFLFQGAEPSHQTIADALEFLCAKCDAHQETMECFVYGPEDLAGSLVHAKQEKDALNAEEQAAVFIGTKFEKALKQEPYEPMMFAAPLFESISKAHRNPNTTASRSLMNALFILSQEDLNISASLLEKYHLDAEKIKTIKRVYNLVVNG